MLLTNPHIEILQIAGLAALLMQPWHKVGPISKTVGLWCIVWLSIDVFVWQCHRPEYVKEVFNDLNVIFGAGVLYENLKTHLKELAVYLLSLFM